MKADKTQADSFRHPGEAEIRRSIDHSRQIRSETLGQGVSEFVGYIRSFKQNDAAAQDDEKAWAAGSHPQTS